MGVVQELASLTMSMLKNYPFPTPKIASDFYSENDLYPFYDIVRYAESNAPPEANGSYMIISEKD